MLPESGFMEGNVVGVHGLFLLFVAVFVLLLFYCFFIAIYCFFIAFCFCFAAAAS